jgi:AcrR family transcriptional regulator
MPRRPGGRTARTRAAALHATVAELAVHGYEELTIERVAARSGVHKTTLYRRWGGRRGLVADAVEAFAAGAAQVPDTGNVKEDLRRWARSIVVMLTARDSAAVVRALFSTSETPEIRDLRQRFYRTRSAMVVPIVERAVARGELPAGTDAAEVIRQVGAPLYYRFLVIAEPLTAAVADLAADAALAAARDGVFAGGGPGSDGQP